MAKLPFGFEKAEDSPGFLLWQTTMIWQRQIKKALEIYNISHAQFVILATLMWFEMNHEDTNQIRIANWTKLDKMTISKSIKKLVDMKYVKRIEDKEDTRAKHVFLTNNGKDLIRKLVPIVEEIDQRFFEKITHSEHKSFIHMLKKLTSEL